MSMDPNLARFLSLQDHLPSRAVVQWLSQFEGFSVYGYAQLAGQRIAYLMLGSVTP